MTTDRRIALIPAYCPGEQLVTLAHGLYDIGFAIVIVNDGSGEEYNGVFDAAIQFSSVLTHPVNQGKGAALKTGLSYIRDVFIPPYTVVTLDADGQHSIEDASRVCDRADSVKQALVLGCREFRGENVKVPKKSLLGNKITRAVFSLTSGMDVSDTQTGLRAFSDRHIERMLSISGERYEYEMNVLMRYAKEGVPIEEVPIETIYIDNNSSSHFDPVHDSARIYKEILKFSASSLICFGLDYLLYCLFGTFLGSITAANIAARVISSCVNFELNRRLVFGSKKSVPKSALQYFTLAAFILLCNTLLLDLLVKATPLGRYAAKLITECAMFIVSWTVQKTMIFRKKEARTK